MTSDEIAHLIAGHVYNCRGDFRLQPENGNLPQRLAALPMSLASVPLPSPTLESWQKADVWEYGHVFFYEQGISAVEWLFLGRAMIAFASAATGMIIFLWSRALFGWAGGFLSLALWVFCPNFLVHDALTTSDALMTFFFLASVGAWWRHLNRPGIMTGALSAATLGLAFVAKFSAILLPPMFALIGIGWAITEAKRRGWRAPVQRLAFTTFGHIIVVWIVIWLFYGFRFSAFAPEFAAGAEFNNGWGWTLTGIGAKAKLIWWLKEWHVLPEAWLYGLAFVLQFSRARGAFMSGEYSITGWITFFPFTFLVKTTLPVLLLLALASISAAAACARRVLRSGAATLGPRLLPFLPLVVLFVVYWATSLASNLNIGHRHILPTYPVLFIMAGWLGRWLDFRRPLGLAAVAIAIGWHAAESLRVRPHYLAYFNQIVGGPSNGWRHLVDSSLDWGQDLPGLKRWLDNNAAREPIYLSYFGTGDPAYEGISATALPTLPEVGPKRRWHTLGPGVYAISATMLQHVYSNIRGEWTLELEKEFQQLRSMESTLLAYQNDAKQWETLLLAAPAQNWTIAWKRYELLRFARLCHYLRVRNPDAMIGHSILIFRVDEFEINAAIGGSLSQWRQLLERAITQRGSSG